MQLNSDYYSLDAYTLARKLIGKALCRRFDDGTVIKRMITETECYVGESDTACHAHRGKTPRNAIMYEAGGYAYVYLCYGLHYLFNVISGSTDHPEGVLIRGIEGANGPGRVTKLMQIDKSLSGENLADSERLWIEDAPDSEFSEHKRVGIDYASEEDRNRLWRFCIKR